MAKLTVIQWDCWQALYVGQERIEMDTHAIDLYHALKLLRGVLIEQIAFRGLSDDIDEPPEQLECIMSPDCFCEECQKEVDAEKRGLLK